MENQGSGNTVKSKEKSKQKFLEAVGRLFMDRGFAALKVNDIAEEAGLDKKLIYRYFGGKDELVNEYIRSLDFWSNVKEEDAPKEITDGGREFSKQMLLQQFDYQSENEAFKKMLLWGLSEKREPLTRVADEREAVGEVLLTHITDPFFGKDAQTYRAAMALLISGSYYLNLYAGVNGTTFCGIDLTTDDGKAKVRKAMLLLVDLLYDDKSK